MAYRQRARTTYRQPAPTRRRIRIRWIRVAGLLVVIAAVGAVLGRHSLPSSSRTAESPTNVRRSQPRDAPAPAVSSAVWPAYGQAAVQIGQSRVHAGPNQHAAPIASVAKVMTAYLVLRDHPGTVHNTNRLLGHDGFVGVKTGSTAAAGGCFAFRAIRRIDGERTTITGVVMGQPGYDQVAAGLAAAEAMVDRITDRRATPGPGTLSPRTGPCPPCWG